MTPEDELLAQIPPEARVEDMAGATNFSRFFLELYPELFAQGASPDLFARLSEESCGFCANALQNAAETQVQGAFSEGSVFTFVSGSTRGGLQDDGFWYVAMAFAVSEARTYDAEGNLIDSAPAGAGEVSLRLAWHDQSWTVNEVDFDFE